jgi:hypothetical protein
MKMQKAVKIIPAILFLFMLTVPNLSAQGHFEFGFHYSRWSIDVLRGLIEEGLSDAMETDLKDNFLEDIQSDYPNLEETSYTQDISFDSSGNNYGFEVRWYPGGQGGSFSMGLSVEKTSMTITLPEVSASLDLKDKLTQEEASFRGDASGEFVINPLSFHLSFRWDIVPSSVVHPYITLGFGAAGGTALEEAEVAYSYTGDLTVPGEDPEHYDDGETKSLKELKDELEAEGEDFFLPGFVPFIQLNLGLKGRLSENIHILVDAGIWNGFLIRGGVAFRL